jgi:hypothetical protein
MPRVVLVLPTQAVVVVVALGTVVREERAALVL